MSWLVPTVNLRVTTVPAGVPGHSWPVVASSRTAMGHRGMIHAAKVLAAMLTSPLNDAGSSKLSGAIDRSTLHPSAGSLIRHLHETRGAFPAMSQVPLNGLSEAERTLAFGSSSSAQPWKRESRRPA